jgi:hypothetical protein
MPFLSPFRGTHRRRLRLVLKVALAVLALVAATVFLQGFLLNGVLSDFKESEKLPAQLASVLENLALEIAAVPQHNLTAEVSAEVAAVLRLAYGVHTWLLGGAGHHQADRPPSRGAWFGGARRRVALLSTLQGRLMGHMGDVLQMINRIETIRQTHFLPLVYWLASLGTGLLYAARG